MMSRLEKKCFVASISMHGFLVLLFLVGSAFILPKERPKSELPVVHVIPTKMIDALLAGGGGNPNIARTEDRQKGDTTVPQPPPVQKPVTKPPPQKETPIPPAKVETKKPQAEPMKLAEVRKPANDAPLDIKRVKRPNADREKADTKATQVKDREIARQQAEKLEHLKTDLAGSLDSAMSKLRSGFQTGTKVEVGGPGGEAYANYEAFVKAKYEDAWVIPPELWDDDSTAKVRVTIARDGRLVSFAIIRKSGNSSLDRSVQRLENVKSFPPFPEGANDDERTFTINFNLKAKRLSG